MKRRIIGLIVVALLFVSLAACSGAAELSPSEAYQAFVDDLREVTNFHFTSEVFVRELSTDTPVSNHSMGATVSAEDETMQMTYLFVHRDGHMTSPIDLTVLDGFVYADLSDWAQNSVYGFLEAMGEDASAFSAAEQLDDDQMLVREPFDNTIEVAAIFGTYFDVFSEEALAEHLSYSEGRFTVQTEGDVFLEYIEPVLRFILFYGGAETANTFVQYGIPRQSDTMGLLEWFHENDVDFQEASFSWSQARSGEGFESHIEVSVPEWLEAEIRIVISPQETPLVARPEGRTVTMQEHRDHTEAVLWAIALGDHLSPSLSGDISTDFEIVHDLSGLRLFDHDLANSSDLEARTLTDSQGRTYAITLVSGDGFFEEAAPNFLLQEMPDLGLMLYYDIVPHANESIIEILSVRALQFMEADADITAGPLRVSDDAQSAALILSGVGMLPFDERFFMLLSQIVPDSDYAISLLVVVARMDIQGDTLAILDDLGRRHIGIDLVSPLLGR